MRRFLVVAWSLMIAVAVVGGAPSPAVAFTGPWLAASDLAKPSISYVSPRVAIGSDGTATAAFITSGVLQVATRPAGGTFGNAIDLDAPGAGESIADFPTIATAADGTVVVAWVHRLSNTNAVVRASVRPPGGSFSPPADVSKPGFYALHPDLAISPNGTAFVTWESQTGPNYTVLVAVRPQGGAFGAPEGVLVSSVDYLYPKIGAGGDGTATLLFTRSTGGGVGYVEATTRNAAGAIAPPAPISGPANYVGAADIGIAADGTPTPIFRMRVGGKSVAATNTRAPDGSWGTPTPLSDGAHDASDPDVTVAADGTALAAWVRSNGQTYVAQARIRSPGGSFGPVIPLSAGGFEAAQPNTAIAGDGTMLVSWLLNDGSKYVMQVATRPVGGDFTTPVSVSGPFGLDLYHHDVALAPDGSAVALFGTPIGPGDRRVKGALTANPPALLSRPSISGGTAVGSALACQGGSFVGASGLDTFWLRGSTEIARSFDYTVAEADRGSALTCRLRATNIFGSVDATSAPLAIPAAPGTGAGPGSTVTAAGPGSTVTAAATPPIARSLPSIRGRARVGRVLRCRPAKFNAAQRLTTSWLRGTKTIKGARRTTYRLTRRDLGKIVTCRTTATGAGGKASTVSLGVLVRR